MPPLPSRPKIYHIVHMDRLASIIADGCLWSDATVIKRQDAGPTIGMRHIKERRLRLPVSCHDGTCVGDYVPFYFCPRSIMLYVIHKASDDELTYRGGQERIVHLEADLYRVIAWADGASCRWAFSLSNAGAFYAPFRSEVARLDEVNWPAIAAIDFRPAEIRHGKQAEFLVHTSFPWQLVERIGVISRKIGTQVADVMRGATHRPPVEAKRTWYY